MGEEYQEGVSSLSVRIKIVRMLLKISNLSRPRKSIMHLPRHDNNNISIFYTTFLRLGKEKEEDGTYLSGP